MTRRRLRNKFLWTIHKTDGCQHFDLEVLEEMKQVIAKNAATGVQQVTMCCEKSSFALHP